ncbi:MAG: hypothetical protein FJY75_05625 [Candidatus Eisenbacteria bacterium]|uniref:FlgD Ig-like domain-containing protein n=1 Tax=Eiseniibacteriota bacterium TaxID=2212470 RepID=A0A938BQL7_UNCEI|nr:hypothetical protein [Candidatus Eisenbacteria bacterium]
MTLLAALLAGTLAAPASAEAPRAVPLRDVPRPVPGEMGPDVLWSEPGARLAPPPDPQVGDSWIWWLWVHFPMPPHWEQRQCTVRGVSDHAYVVVEDTQWNVRVHQADVDLILERWENSSIGPYPDQGIYAINSAAFGEPPDELDNDPRIYILWFDFGINADGFFFSSDQFPEGATPDMHSNECEVLYLNSNSSGGGPSSDYMISVIAHEFEHMIHWKYDPDEASWVDEGLAELAMWFYGRPDVISGFNANPDNSLIVWNGNWSDYIKTYLWSLYFYERYGGHPSIYSVVHEPLNSIAGYEAVLDLHGYTESFADVFADWVVANYLDDASIGDGRFGYQGAALPPFNAAYTFTAYPVIDFARTVNYWAADYYRFRNVSDLGSLRLEFDGADNNRFAVWALTLHSAEPTEVRRMALDPATQAGVLDVPGLADPADEVILVVAGISSAGSPVYYIDAGASPAATPELAGAVGGGELRLESWPSPTRDGATLRLRWEGPTAGPARVSVHDSEGRLVRLLRGGGGSGATTLLWDGRTSAGSLAAPGVYYLRGEVGGLKREGRLVRLP